MPAIFGRKACGNARDSHVALAFFHFHERSLEFTSTKALGDSLPLLYTLHPRRTMSETTERKSRWDAPASGSAGGDAAPPAPASAGGDKPPSAADNEAAQKAAAIAAKIAASLRPPGSTGFEVARRAGAPEGDFVKDIEINDLRNRYVLTRSSTQKNVSAPRPA